MTQFDKGLLEAVSKLLEVPTLINEGINDHEETHKKILKDLHKHYPEMNVKAAEHSNKMSNRGAYGKEEFHTYHADIPVHDSVKHLFKSLKAKVTISHHNDKPQHHHASLDYEYTHHNGSYNSHPVARHWSHTDDQGKHKTLLRSESTGHTKEV